MDEWLEINGKPLEEMEQDIASIECQFLAYTVPFS